MSHFVFLGHVLEANRIASLARLSGVFVEVKATDIAADAMVVNKDLAVPLVVSHENKYHLLAAPSKELTGEMIKVKLISKVTLKKFCQG